MKLSRLLPCLALVAQLVWAAPPIAHWQTPSGVRVLFVESHELPLLDVQVDFPAGSAYDPPGKAGLAALTHALLDLGVRGSDETQIANRLADVGAQLSGSVEIDRASLKLRTLSAPDQRLAALEVLRSVLVSPHFPPTVFAREQARTVAALKDDLTRPETIASQAFWRALYPDHPYGRQASPASVMALKRADALAFYRQHYAARRATLTIVGDLSREQAEALAQRLTRNLPAGGGAPALAAPSAPTASELRIAHPAAQAHLLIGLPALARGDPDDFALQVGNYTLGAGGFVSRLMKAVREQRGLAYSVHSEFSPLAQPGPFEIALQTRGDQADAALQVVREVLAGFLADGPSDDELRAAKRYLVGSFPLRVDSNRKILENVAVIGFYGLPLDYLERYGETVEQVTAAQVKAALARHVQPQQMVTVVVGGKPGAQ